MAFQPFNVVGGSSEGTDFSCYGGTNGKTFDKIGVWAATCYIKAIRVWLTGDDAVTFGDPSQPSGEEALHYAEFTFQQPELITHLSLWGDGIGNRTGWIYFETNLNRRFDFGMYDWEKKTEYPSDVGGGICAGVLGRAGSDIDRLGFVFLKPIASSKLLNVQYPSLSFAEGGIAPETLGVYNHTNNTDSTEIWEYSGILTRTISSSWSLTAGLTLHERLSVSAGVPGVAEVGGEFGWMLSVPSTYPVTSTASKSLLWDVSGALESGESIHRTATSYRGSITLPYTGSIEVALINGYIFQYSLQGQYSGISYSVVIIN